jgi:predicted RNA binding protein YcfA (HicA-like mRNA interferase family)
MAGAKMTLESVKQGVRNIAFRDLQHLLEKLGFRLNRVSGSHHIYIHPKVPRPMNVQAAGKDAKPYQVRQLKHMIEEFGLRLEE